MMILYACWERAKLHDISHRRCQKARITTSYRQVESYILYLDQRQNRKTRSSLKSVENGPKYSEMHHNMGNRLNRWKHFIAEMVDRPAILGTIVRDEQEVPHLGQRNVIMPSMLRLKRYQLTEHCVISGTALQHTRKCCILCNVIT